MNAALLHNCIDKYNILEAPTRRLAAYFDAHPEVYKITLIINHLFRAATMVGLMYLPYIEHYISMPLCFVGSLFYRLTVEKNCAYKFALPAFFGAMAFVFSAPALFNGIGWEVTSTLERAAMICFALYLVYIILTVKYDVEHAAQQRVLEGVVIDPPVTDPA